MRIIGIDPGLLHTGWGIIEKNGNSLKHIADGAINPPPKISMPERLFFIFENLQKVIETYSPDTAAIEETFVNDNPLTSLKLGQARGAAITAAASASLSVSEYSANLIKKSVTGVGHATKDQIAAMVKILLGGIIAKSADSADALAVAITHAHLYNKKI